MAKVAETKKKHPKTMIGWREWCSLPTLGLPAVRAKIDTGARTSALHAYDIQYFKKGTHTMVHFKVHPLHKTTKVVKTCKAPMVGKRVIVSSNGKRELRPVIKTELTIGDNLFTTELTLTSRHEMNFRMLLGRRAMRAGRLTVDPSKSYLLGKVPKAETLYKRKPRMRNNKYGSRKNTAKTQRRKEKRQEKNI
jgi:ribosomal protein S6--L-glutamate ligase